MTDDDNNNTTTTASDGNKKGNKQRKASKWRAMKQKKKEQKRKKFADNGDADNNGDSSNAKKPKLNHWKRDYDGGSVTPHEGSFAHPEMQKLFDVKIGVDDDDDLSEDKANENSGAEQTEDSKEAASTEAAAVTTTTPADTDKVPKRKLAFLVSFLGSNYSGFQINALTKSLHSEIELGLYRAGLISKANFGHPSKYSWSNSARTDKGVHAAAQVCSFKGEMIYQNEIDDFKKQLDAMREKVNECLPDDVRILDFERVTRTFCARTSRDKVRYQYMVPAFMFCSRDEVRKTFAVNDDNTAPPTDRKLTPMEASKLVQDDVSPDVLSAARTKLLQYRVPPETLQRLRDGLKLFEGTHSFHNYTRRVGADNASATRYIIKFAPLEPVIVPGREDGQSETQWVPVQVTGQSFLLNQIRKMISAAVDHARGVVSTERITQSMSKDCRMKVNVAPAQGLFLDRSFFDLYNKHKVKNAPKHGNQPELEILDWVEEDEKEMPAAGKTCNFV
jgi:tRNA pseudouridine38-40 synthase